MVSNNPINGGATIKLPSDVEILNGIQGDPTFMPKFYANRAQSRDNFFSTFANAYARLLEVTLDGTKLGPFVSTEPSDPFGFMSNAF
ncbi:hypothetical protein HDU98_007378 [Podochytrium sp. JEL0797]|nr:hypothetical protein HDU98_007378 [Podochytrium sp. JEL0797]